MSIIADTPAIPAALLDADRAADPAVAAQRANTFVPVPGAVAVPAPVASLADLMKTEADKYRAAMMRGDVRAAASGLAAVGVLFDVAANELGASLSAIEAALVDAFGAAR
ncbi:hypothetical protein NGM36_26180 [Streptomyces mutabilis]|uniref:hypothetical protein n=1 Tax=Streptomyces mutabilis TaxID=67332 RepID=UPI0022BA3B98|nr:hypothetical protein [Streptomyces mutabilis]MCZ9353212.1 hypothetical protein [Streptomyces mutabilis]